MNTINFSTGWLSRLSIRMDCTHHLWAGADPEDFGEVKKYVANG